MTFSRRGGEIRRACAIARARRKKSEDLTHYETRTPATDLAPLVKETTNRSPCVLGSLPMHILPPVVVGGVVAPAFDNDASSNDRPTRERCAEAIGGKGRECRLTAPPPEKVADVGDHPPPLVIRRRRRSPGGGSRPMCGGASWVRE